MSGSGGGPPLAVSTRDGGPGLAGSGGAQYYWAGAGGEAAAGQGQGRGSQRPLGCAGSLSVTGQHGEAGASP